MTAIITHKNIVYHTTDREPLLADVYLPAIGENHPVVLMIHGGAYQAGSKEMYDDWGPLLSEQGYAAITINYRLATRDYAAYPGLLDDVKAALDFIVKSANQWQLDPQKIAVMGDSAGGYLATMMALLEGYTSFTIKSVVSAYGVFDLLEWATYTSNTRSDFVINKLFGFDRFVGKAAYQQGSPMTLIENIEDYFRFDTEFMLIWGEEDNIVLPEPQSVIFSAKLTSLGVKHDDLIIPDRGHFWFTKNGTGAPGASLAAYPNDGVVPKVLAFLARTLQQDIISDPTTKQVK